VCAALLVAAGLAGCSEDAGGPKAITIGVSVTDMVGAAAADLCVRVPVLLGSVVLQQRSVGNAFSVDLRAMRHSVQISFPGATNEGASLLNVPVTTLSDGYSKTLSVSGRDSATYSASVHTGCSVANTESDP
jgi:hypothetical protein